MLKEGKRPRTLAELNKFLHAKGMPKDQEIVKGKGYFWVDGGLDVSGWPSTSIFAYKLSDLTFGSWWEEYQNLVPKESQWEGRELNLSERVLIHE